MYHYRKFPVHQFVYLLSVSPDENEGGGSCLPATLMLLWLGARYVLREVCSLTGQGLGHQVVAGARTEVLQPKPTLTWRAAELGQESQASSCLRKGTPLA